VAATATATFTLFFISYLLTVLVFVVTIKLAFVFVKGFFVRGITQSVFISG